MKSKSTALDTLVGKFGPCVIRGFEPDEQYTRVYSTGLVTFDEATGIGGLPRGKIVELFGAESSGKSVLMLHMMGRLQQDRKRRCVYCDLERATPPQWMRIYGIDPKRLLTVTEMPKNDKGIPSGERFFDLLYSLIDQDRYGLIVVDSIAVITHSRVMEGDVEDSDIPGLQARMIQKGLSKIAPRLSETNTVLVFINQVRSKVGVMWGSNETTTGGRALKHWKALAIRVSRMGGETARVSNGHRIKIKITKNKLAAPGGEAEVDLNYKTGIDMVAGVLRAVLDRGIVEGAGKKMSLYGRPFSGRESIRKALAEEPEFFDQVRKALASKDDEPLSIVLSKALSCE